MMETTTLIDLDAQWECEWLELDPHLYEFMRPEQVADVAAWTFDRRRVEGWAAYLYRDFELPATVMGMGCWLYIDSAPSPSRLYVNHQYLGEYHAPPDDAPPFELDVTPHIHAGTNQIAFRVEGDSSGTFHGLSLHLIPQEVDVR